MVRVSNREIEIAEQIVENSEFPRIWREYRLYRESLPRDNFNNILTEAEEDYEKIGDYCKRLNRAMRVGVYPLWKQQCPTIKWIRKFAEEYSRNIPENTKTYQRRSNPQFIPDDNF